MSVDSTTQLSTEETKGTKEESATSEEGETNTEIFDTDFHVFSSFFFILKTFIQCESTVNQENREEETRSSVELDVHESSHTRRVDAALTLTNTQVDDRVVCTLRTSR